jgi:site-specific DNA-methyltransferase (adenine-specific)
MLADRRIRLIQDFPKNYDVFKGANIPGGVSYFLWDRDHDGPCEFNGISRYLNEFDIVVRDNMSISILKKVLKKHSGKPFCDSRVFPQKPFGLRTNFRNWVDEGTEGAVKCYAQKRCEKRVASGCYTDPHNILKLWKVLGSAGTGHNGEIFTKGKNNIGYRNVFLGDNNSICLETYIVLGAFNTKKEAENYIKYTQTKFFQVLLSLRVSSQILSRDKFSWVPDFEDYTVEYTDQDLYEYFGLTKREIDHIENTIKESTDEPTR